MQPDILQLKDQLFALPAITRSLLADALVESLLEDDAAVVAEAMRRKREVDEGKVECIPAEEVIASMDAALE